MKFSKEIWKNIQFPKTFKTSQKYQISNYGRVRNLRADGSFHIKKGIVYERQLVYRFNFPEKLNDGVRLQLHQKANHLVAASFCKGYQKGCYVVWQDYNRLNNFYKNLLILNGSEGRSFVKNKLAKEAEQFMIFPPSEEENPKEKSESHKVVADDDYFKTMDKYPLYEINRHGVIRRRVAPFKGRIMKQRKHPDNFYFLDLLDANKKRKTVYPHKEVARNWNINVTPEKRTLVVHLDGDTLNNSSDNLEWMDHSEALKHGFKIKKRDNRKSWKTRKDRYGNGFKDRGESKENHT